MTSGASRTEHYQIASNKLGLCLGWKGQLICCVTRRGGREGGSHGGRQGGKQAGRVGGREGGREGGVTDCYTYSNIIKYHHSI